MNKNSKIYLAGHTGLVGSAILKNLRTKGYQNIIFTPYPEYDLVNQETVREFFEKEKPEYVIIAAAKVGGIQANNSYRAQFIYENLMIQSNIIHFAYKNKVKKLLFLGSSCIYPKNCPQPIKEEYMLTGELEYTNEPYAIAKIAGIRTCESYNLQYGTNFLSVMPTNLYGPNDNYNLETSHVLPAFIRKMHLGSCLENNDWGGIKNDLNKRPIENISGQNTKDEILAVLSKHGIEQKPITHNHDYYRNYRDHKSPITIKLWGSGAPRREFLYSEDMADACIYIMEKVNFEDLKEGKKNIRNCHINIGTGQDLTIKELADMVKKITGFKGNITWNTDIPDGTFQKQLDITKLEKLGWKYTVSLEDGIRRNYEWFLA